MASEPINYNNENPSASSASNAGCDVLVDFFLIPIGAVGNVIPEVNHTSGTIASAVEEPSITTKTTWQGAAQTEAVGSERSGFSRQLQALVNKILTVTIPLETITHESG